MQVGYEYESFYIQFVDNPQLNIKYKRISIIDDDEEDIYSHFSATCQFIGNLK